MRLWGLALSTVLLTGCSFVDGVMGSKGPAGQHYGGQIGGQPGFADPCQIPHAQAPIPRGCHPSQVSIGLSGGQFGPAGGPNFAGGFAQTPQFGGQYADAGYGSHAGGNVHTQGLHGAAKPRLRKPRFRGALDLGVERSVSGEILNYGRAEAFDPFLNYDPYAHVQGTRSGSQADGVFVRTTSFADSIDLPNASDPRRVGSEARDPAEGGIPFDQLAPYDAISRPDISFDDAWSAPVSLGLSGEYIMNDRATLFGRVGYTTSEGTSGDAASAVGTVYRDVDEQVFAEGLPVGGEVSNRTFVPEQTIATFAYDFTDMRRLDLEAGGRLYLDPIAGQSTGRTVTPFVGASAGASHYNAVSYQVSQNQLSYSSVFEGGDPRYFPVRTNPSVGEATTVELYDSQWVPTGRLAVGAEWQLTPKTALAFETGVKIDGKREYTNGNSGQNNVSIPVTLRGSFNF